MAVLTPTSTIRESSGSLTQYFYEFSPIVRGDTFVSGISGQIVGFDYFVNRRASTQASGGANVFESAGTFTFEPGEQGKSGVLIVWART